MSKGYAVTDFNGLGIYEIEKIDDENVFEDDEEAVDILPVLDIAQQTLGEHARLAAARSGGDEHGAAAAFDRGSLRGGGFDLTHRSPPLRPSAPRPRRP